MHTSKGGITLNAVLEMEMEELADWVEAAVEFQKRINSSP